MKKKIPEKLRKQLSAAGKKSWKIKVKKALASEVDTKKEPKVEDKKEKIK